MYGALPYKEIKFNNLKNNFDMSTEDKNTDKIGNDTIHSVTKWVAIDNKMPKSGQCVMIYSKNGGVAEGAYIGSKGYFKQWRWNAIKKDVTHWKPLCEPPCL